MQWKIGSPLVAVYSTISDNNAWTIPAFLPWYKTNVAHSTPIFLTFIECKLSLPYAIARNAIPTAITY